jgi:hypothetical protein
MIHKLTGFFVAAFFVVACSASRGETTGAVASRDTLDDGGTDDDGDATQYVYAPIPFKKGTCKFQVTYPELVEGLGQVGQTSAGVTADNCWPGYMCPGTYDLGAITSNPPCTVSNIENFEGSALVFSETWTCPCVPYGTCVQDGQANCQDVPCCNAGSTCVESYCVGQGE